MAVYDQSYAPWTGTYAPRWRRVAAIASSDLAQPFRNRWIRLILILMFVVGGGWLILLFFAASAQTMPPMVAGNRLYRDGFFNFPLVPVILGVLCATVGAPLVARDLRYNALLMYFSRAITRADYVSGKFLALAAFMLFATLGPALLLFMGQLGMGAEKLKWTDRLADLGAVTVHALIVALPMSATALAFSSLTRRATVAAILWTSFYFSSMIVSELLQRLLKESWCRMISWTNLTSHLANYVYPPRPAPKPVLDCGWVEPLVILASLTVLSLAVVWRRIGAVEVRE